MKNEYRYKTKADFDAFIAEHGLPALLNHEYIPGQCAPDSEAKSYLDRAIRLFPTIKTVCDLRRDGMSRSAIESVLKDNPDAAEAIEISFEPTPQVQVQVRVEEMAPKSVPEFVDPLPNVPKAMKEVRQWVRWRLEKRDGKWTKVPYQVNGRTASSTDPNTWTDYRTAVTGAKIDSTQGVGFVVNGDFVGVDLDGCRDPKTDTIAPWAEKIIDALDSYTEITPSQTGLRVWVRGVLPGKDKVFNLNPAVGYGDKVKIEVFTDSRYFTVTGDAFFDPAGTSFLQELLDQGLDFDVEERDLTEVYKLLHDIRAQHPVPVNPKSVVADAVDSSSGSGAAIEYAPGTTFKTDKYTIFKHGQIVEGEPNFQITDGIGTLAYPSHSEADLGFATVLALIHDGDTEKMDADFRESALYREKWERDDYRARTFEKALATAKKVKEKKSEQPPLSHVDLEVREVAECEVAESEKVSPLVLPNSALTSSVFGDLFDQVFAPNGWTMEFALPALATAASVLVPQQKAEGQLFEPPFTTLYTALIGGVNVGKSQVAEWAARAVGIYNELRSAQYAQSKFGSAEQMWKFLHKYSTQGTANTLNPFRDAVLVNLDEWSHLMSKAGIPDSTFASALTTAFYSRRTTVTLGGQGGGRDILIPFPFSMIGGVVDDQFGHSFNSASTGGLYSRMLFGLAPEGFQWAYCPFPHEHAFFQSKGKLELKPVAVTINPNVWEVTNGWKKNDPTLDRIPEIVVRIATIFASIDGRRILEAKDVEKMRPLVTYQKAVRSIYRPNPGKNPDAVYANVALNWINAHAEQWRTTKELKDGTNYFRRELGPRACYYALMALAQNHDIEFWVSEVGSGGNLNDLPADYQGKRPKIGMGLVRKVLD